MDHSVVVIDQWHKTLHMHAWHTGFEVNTVCDNSKIENELQLTWP